MQKCKDINEFLNPGNPLTLFFLQKYYVEILQNLNPYLHFQLSLAPIRLVDQTKFYGTVAMVKYQNSQSRFPEAGKKLEQEKILVTEGHKNLVTEGHKYSISRIS